MAILTKDQILKADDLKKELVSVPEWGGEVWVQSLSGEERDRFESTSFRIEGTTVIRNTENLRARLVSLSIVDEDGKLIFTVEDIKELGKKNAYALDRVFSVAQRLSRLMNRDIEKLAKNLPTGQAEDSISD